MSSREVIHTDIIRSRHHLSLMLPYQRTKSRSERGERSIVHSRSVNEVKEIDGVWFIVIDPNCKSERGERSIVHSRSYEAKVKEVNTRHIGRIRSLQLRNAIPMLYCIFQ